MHRIKKEGPSEPSFWGHTKEGRQDVVNRLGIEGHPEISAEPPASLSPAHFVISEGFKENVRVKKKATKEVQDGDL